MSKQKILYPKPMKLVVNHQCNNVIKLAAMQAIYGT